MNRELDRTERPHIEPLEDRILLATCHVTRLSDGGAGFGFRGDLRYCINKVNDVPGPDTIDFRLSGTINLTGALPALTTDIDIVEGPYAVTVRRDTGGSYRILAVSAGATVRVTGLTLTNGSVDGDVGGAILNAGNLTLITVDVQNSTATLMGSGTGRGGGLYNAGTAILKSSTLSGNKVTGGDVRGGGIYNASGASLTLEQTFVDGNRADWQGGGIYNASTLSLTGSDILSNTSYGNGGGIYNAAGSSFTMTASSVSNNVATRLVPNGSPFHYGGGFYNSPNVIGVITDSSIANNRAEVTSGNSVTDAYVRGGGIYGGKLTIINSSITGNKADLPNYIADYPQASGGGIADTELTISYCTISGNTASATGRGVFAAGGGIGVNIIASVTISHSTISGNSASAFGDAEISGAFGGGVYGWSMTLTNSTISNNAQSGNHDQGYSGGIYATSAIVTHSTIAGNTNGGVYVRGTIYTLRNSIVANNTVRDISGTIANSGYNLIENPTGGSGYVPSDMLNVDPMLGPLTHNGGPTLTMGLLPGSPAIDSGTNQMAPEWDQRGAGFPRIVNGTIDRGAFEVQATGAPLPTNYLSLLITADLNSDDSNWRI